MEHLYLIAGFVSLFFAIGKIAQMKLIDKEDIPLKFLVRDMLLVYLSVIVGAFIVEQLVPIMSDIDPSQSQPAAFTDNPSF